MDSKERQLDPLLKPIVDTADRNVRDAMIEQLINVVAVPVVEQSLRAKFRLSRRFPSDHYDDLRHDVMVRLLGRLRRLDDPDLDPIASFRDYAAVVTFHVFSNFMRQSYPERVRLKHRIRYLVKRHRMLALWQTPAGEVLCGRRELAGAPAFADSAAEFVPQVEGEDLDAFVLEWLERAKTPVPLETVVSASFEHFRLAERRRPATAVTAPAIIERMADSEFLAALWQEIRALPRQQRVALLLSLRDANGSSVVPLLPLTGVATLEQIAEALEISNDRLHDLWPRLPIDDNAISGMLSLTRQQVINLRKAARRRLARRTASPENRR